MDDAFKYIRDNGIDSEVSYPYRGHVRAFCMYFVSVCLSMYVSLCVYMCVQVNLSWIG